MTQIVPLEIFYIYFSPYTAHAIEIDRILYPTVEHAYQCSRYTDQNVIEEIRNAPSPVKAWEISTKYKHLQIPEFKNENHKLKVMKKLMKLKALQHEDVRQALKDTKDSKIIKHIVTYPPGDGFWDDGKDGKGLNHTGKMWMEIREELFS
ncbi:MAG: NADAR family protein [bacterium]